MAGLLAAGMLRKDCHKVIEAKDSLPDNHSAVLRFKTSIVGDTLNIPFKKVKAVKAVHPWLNPVADVMAYSKKTNGNYTLRSITSANGDLVERFIAPPNFPSKMAEAVQCEIVFGVKVGTNFLQSLSMPAISTLPMPVLMDLLPWDGPKPQFQSLEGWTVTAELPGCDMYCSLYIPDPLKIPYRVSINGSQLIIETTYRSDPGNEEILRDAILADAFEALGLRGKTGFMNPKIQRQKFIKILPIDETVRRKFIIWASDNHNIFSLGRFATWRPGLLLDDVVNDVRVIQHIQKNSNYSHRSKP